VRFQTCAVIHSCDPSRVGRLLEESLRDVTIEIVRNGCQITLRGLGPGSVSMDKDDVTVLTLEEQDDAVSIVADGVFDGTYLGGGADQEKVVCSKLERVFDLVQKQIDLEEMRTTVTRTTVSMQPANEIGPVPLSVATERDVAVPTEVPLVAKRDGGVFHFGILDEARMNRVADVVPAHYRQSGFLVATIVGIAMIATGIGDVQRLLRREDTAPSAMKPAPVATQTAPVNSSAIAIPLVSIPSTRDLTAVSSSVASRLPDRSTDPVTWLGHWEKAMRTRNADEQSSFYADSVDRYQGQMHMTKADVQQRKQAAIASRKGLWTVKVEGLAIQKRTKDEVDIQLVKHVIDQPAPKQISEQFVQTQLRLKRVKGAWQIVSEEDVAESPTPLDPRS
jgi:hypothetical protein